MGKTEAPCDCNVIHEEVIEKLCEIKPDAEQLFTIADFFRIFGDSTRIGIIWALDKSELCVCDIASLLGMTKSAVSHQLKVLRDYKVVKTRREGRVIFYSLSDDHVKEIFEKAEEHINESK
ncbi:MAG: winged helix-turn-helix transcriptional regulator [Clostridia bacterium]|nr:winged helix-turn-helix transcriptional regulator [Clostridia bacterium]